MHLDRVQMLLAPPRLTRSDSDISQGCGPCMGLHRHRQPEWLPIASLEPVPTMPGPTEKLYGVEKHKYVRSDHLLKISEPGKTRRLCDNRGPRLLRHGHGSRFFLSLMSVAYTYVENSNGTIPGRTK